MTEWKPTEQNIGQPVSDNYIQSQGTLYIHNPKTICRCDLFGQGQMVISFFEEYFFICYFRNQNKQR